MMYDNISLYKTSIPSTAVHSQNESTAMNSQFYPAHDDDGNGERRSCMSVKRKLSDYQDNSSLIRTLNHVSIPFDHNNSDESDDDDDDEDENNEDEDDDDDDDDDDHDVSSGEDEDTSEDESHQLNPLTTPCSIIQRRHSDTSHISYGTPIVKRRCTYSSMHDDEQKRSVLVESYRKLRGVKKPKLQVSLLICNLIKRLEKTFTKTPPLRQNQNQEQEHVQYYQYHRTNYRSSSSDSIYMSSLSSTLVNDEIEATNQQYSSSHSSNYDSDKVLLPVNDLRSTQSMYQPSSTDAYWLAQSNFAVPVVSISEDDDVDASLHGGGDYLDLSDNTLSTSFSSCSSSSSSSSNDCSCSFTSSPTITKLLVDNNNNNINNNNNDGYFIYHHHHHHHSSSMMGQNLFYPHNGNNTVDIITTA